MIKHQLNISVITVVLNNCAFIKDAIESVLNQEAANIEYIIIDGGSKDGSIDIINSYKDQVSVIVSEPDRGIYDAMNKGLALASGDIVGFLNADDFYADSTVLKKVEQAFGQHQCDALYADLDYVSRSDKGNVIRKWRSGTFYKKRFKQGWMPPHPTFFVKRECYQRFGGFKDGLGTAADYELMLRFLFVHSLKVFYLPEVIIKMRVGGQSNRSFKSRLLANVQDRKAWAVNNIKPRWYTLLLKPLSKIVQYLK